MKPPKKRNFPEGKDPQKMSRFIEKAIITFLICAGLGLPAWAIYRGQNTNIDPTSLILKVLILLKEDKSQKKEKGKEEDKEKERKKEEDKERNQSKPKSH